MLMVCAFSPGNARNERREVMDEDSLVCLSVFPREQEAELARMRLEANGIPVFISADDCGSWRPWLQLSMGVRLMVRSVDAEHASEVLNDPPIGHE